MRLKQMSSPVPRDELLSRRNYTAVSYTVADFMMNKAQSELYRL